MAAPPLLLRGIQNKIDLTYGFSQLLPNTPSSWVLTPKGQPGSEVEVVLGLDRANATGNPGDLLAGVLQLTDSLGHTHVDLAVSATVASEAGLWVGAAAVNEVGQYLLSYLRDNDSQLIVNTNGAYIVTSVVTNLTPVPTAYPLRLIVHNPSSGPATLLQRVYYGFNVASNSIVANQEAVLAPNLLGAARRISASHLPWSEANPGWFFNRSLAQGAILSVLVTNLFNDQVSNPFLHTYHPDHDNLDAQFKNELPQGSESYTVVRQVTLSVTPPANHFASRVAAGLTLTGEYLETIRVLGLARAGNSYDARRFDVKGDFKLNRISEISTLTRVP